MAVTGLLEWRMEIGDEGREGEARERESKRRFNFKTDRKMGLK